MASASADKHIVAAEVNGYLRQIVSAMRRNSKFTNPTSKQPRPADETSSDLLCGLHEARSKVLESDDISTLEVNEIVSPILEVVNSPEVSGPITRAALMALSRLMRAGMIDSNRQGTAKAIGEIAVSASNARFQPSSPGSDQSVLGAIINALSAIVETDAFALLSDEHIETMISACVRIFRQRRDDSAELELLRLDCASCAESICRATFRAVSAKEKEQGGDGEDRQSDASAPVPFGKVAAERMLRIIMSLIDAGGASSETTETSQGSARQAGDQQSRHGMQSNNATQSSPVELEEEAELGCALLNSAITSGSEALRELAELRDIALGPVCRHLVSAGSRSKGLHVLSLSSSALMSLYSIFPKEFKAQLQIWMQAVLTPICDGRIGTNEQQHIALESLVDLCRIDNLVMHIYCDFDCHANSPNLFEDELVAALSKAAFPVSTSLSVTHMLALDGLTAIVGSLASRASQLPSPVDQPKRVQECPDDGSFNLGRALELTVPHRNGNGQSGQDEDEASTDSEEARMLQKMKAFKRRLVAAAEHFNKRPSKGIEFLQHNNLASSSPTAEEISTFLTLAGPKLDKNVMGEFLGEPGDVEVAALGKYTLQFDFTDVQLEKALRMFLENFALPGESQKIGRILEHFAHHYASSNPKSVADADSAYVLSYSVIMLNTDLHNDKVRRKMTLEQFIKNNRGLNGGEDWPHKLLCDIYESISRNEIKTAANDTPPPAGTPGGSSREHSDAGSKDNSNQAAQDAPAVIPLGKWHHLTLRMTEQAHSKLVDIPEPNEAHGLDAEMFGILWGPATAAITVIFDHAIDEKSHNEALEGIVNVAKIAATHRLYAVLDSLLASLCRFSSALVNANAAQFGHDRKARLAAVAAFRIARRHGDMVRHGWANIVDAMLKLHKIDLLPDSICNSPFCDENADKEEGRKVTRMMAKRHEGSMPNASNGSKSAPASLLKSLSNSFSAILSLDGDESSQVVGKQSPRQSSDSNPRASTSGERKDNEEDGEDEEEQMWRRVAVECIDSCGIDGLVADTKFLEEDSLADLVKAIEEAYNSQRDVQHSAHRSNYNNSNASNEVNSGQALCIHLLVAITLRNKERLSLVWPSLHNVIALNLADAMAATEPVVLALESLLRLTSDILGTDRGEDHAEMLLGSLRLVFNLDARVAEQLIGQVSAHLVKLTSSCAPRIKQNESHWETLCKLLALTSAHPAASESGLRALQILVGDYLNPTSLPHFVSSAEAHSLAFAGGCDHSVKAVALLSKCTDALKPISEGQTGGFADAIWSATVSALSNASQDERRAVREEAIPALQRAALLSKEVDVSPAVYENAFNQSLLPLLFSLIDMCKSGGNRANSVASSNSSNSNASKDDANAAHSPESAGRENAEAKSMKQVMVLLCKLLLHCLDQMVHSQALDSLWDSLLKGAEMAMRQCSRDEEVKESIVEALRNVLNILHDRGLLANDTHLHKATAKKAKQISPSLHPKELASA